MAARTFTLDQLVTRLREMTDTESDTHLGAQEAYRIMSSACAQTWDLMLRAGLGEKKVKSSTFNTISGTQEYDLTSATQIADQDFYKISQVLVNEGNGQFRPVDRIHPAEVLTYRAPASVVAMKIYYIPRAPTFQTAGVFDGTLTFDGISGWEEHSLATAATTLKGKREEDYQLWKQMKAEQEDRILFMGRTDHSGPSRVVKRRRIAKDPFSLYRNNVNAYMIRGDKLELLYAYGYVP